MTERAWFYAFTLAWAILALASGLAIHRGLFDSDLREYSSIAAAVFGAGVAPLTWLGLSGRYDQIAKTDLAKLLATPFATGTFLVLLALAGVALGCWSLRLGPVQILCQPKDALISIDRGRPAPCAEVHYARSSSRVTSALAEDHESIDGPLAGFRSADGIYRLVLPRSVVWHCKLKERRLFNEASNACGRGTWNSSTDFWISLTAEGDSTITGSVLEIQSRDQISDVVIQTVDERCAVAQGPANKELFDSELELSAECLNARRALDVIVTSCDPAADGSKGERGMRERFRLLMKAPNRGAQDAIEIACN